MSAEAPQADPATVPVPLTAPPEPNGGVAAVPPTPAVQAGSVFGAIRQRAAAKAMPYAYMTAEEKDIAWRLATPLYLVDVVEDNGQYGLRYNFVTVDNPAIAPNGEYTSDTAKAISLSHSNFRVALADEIRALLPSAKIIGPVYLTKFRTNNNQLAWDLAEVPQEEQVKAEIAAYEAANVVQEGATQTGAV